MSAAEWGAPGDEVGAITLRRMARLEAYNAWLHARFESHLGNRILEVGSGVGNQTRYFADRERVVASDIEPDYVRELVARFDRHANVRTASFGFPLRAGALEDLRQERIDTIVCLNVLEHIEDDRATLVDFSAILPSGGSLVLLVPAMPWIYGTLDKYLNHHRRYERRPLERLVTGAGFMVDDIRYLNLMGAFGWWLNSRVLRRRVLPSAQIRAFRFLLPLLKFEEHMPPPFGLSLLVLARRG